MSSIVEGNQHNLRVDILRPIEDASFADLEKVVMATYSTFSKLEKVLSPYIAKNTGGSMPFRPPTKELLRELIKKPAGNLNEITYSQMLNAAISFCERNKGKKQLPLPHPTTMHHAQFSDGLFKIYELTDKATWPTLKRHREFIPTSLWAIEIAGCEKPVYVENLKSPSYKYIIMRPKMAKLGTPSTTNWEVLMYKRSGGYLIEHIDSELNPKYVGKF